MKTIGVPDYMN